MIEACKSTVFLWLFVTALMTTSFPEEGGETVTLVNYEKHPIDNDFEEGTVAPWLDLSEGGTCWVIQTIAFDSGTIDRSAIQPASPPAAGKYFLVMKQVLETFDMGTLSTTNFIAFPGDQLQFSFWISSTWSQFHNLQVKFVFLSQEIF